MSDVTRILSQIEQGNSQAAEKLLPLVYDELRKLASVKLAQEKPGQTLQATALVHEAYLRLVDSNTAQSWDSRGHFFAAAAEAMRRILIESARRKLQERRGGGMARIDLDEAEVATRITPDQMLALDDALAALESQDAGAGQVFKLRYFTGCSIEDAAELLGLSRATAYRHWSFARAWLLSQLGSAT
jgi:RNA polymerase sigma factor (TIGR02999 family)